MPRVENLGENVDRWCHENGEGSSTYDVCSEHHDELVNDPHAHNTTLIPYGSREPQGEGGWGGDIEHPDYDSFSPYFCAICGVELSGATDGYA